MLICDCLTGDSNTLGETFLAAGTYEIETGFFERGGGSSYELYANGPGTATMLLMAGAACIDPRLGRQRFAACARAEHVCDGNACRRWNRVGSSPSASRLSKLLEKGRRKDSPPTVNVFRAGPLRGVRPFLSFFDGCVKLSFTIRLPFSVLSRAGRFSMSYGCMVSRLGFMGQRACF